MTEREGVEGSQLSQALDFVPLRQRVLGLREPLHGEKIINGSYVFPWLLVIPLAEVTVID